MDARQRGQCFGANQRRITRQDDGKFGASGKRAPRNEHGVAGAALGLLQTVRTPSFHTGDLFGLMADDGDHGRGLSG